MSRRCVVRSALAGLLCALSLACDDSPTTPPNVVLIVMDTVRADHLSCYGYARKTTPSIDAFAGGADRYTLARSTAPWTLPSHASLFTGRFPFQHGAEAAKDKNGVVIDALPLPPDEVTLAEVLLAEGYQTAAFAANRGYVNALSGLDQGFTTFVNERLDGRGMTQLASDWLAKRAPQRPFFVFMNYMDAHRTYNTTPLPPERAKDLPAPLPPGQTADKYLNELCDQVLARRATPRPELVQQVEDLYDIALANLDLAVGALLDDLKAKGLYDDALIIVTADHGEYFGEHELVEHSKDVYEPALRIPLIVKRPGQTRGRTLDAPISIADVPRRVLDSMPKALATKYAAQFPGSSDAAGIFAEVKYARPKDMNSPWAKRFDRERAAIYVENYKLIRSSDGQHELYDLAADPGELHNLFAERPKEAEALGKRLQRAFATARKLGDIKAIEMTPEQLKTMKDLGYFGDDDEPQTKGERAPSDKRP